MRLRSKSMSNGPSIIYGTNIWSHYQASIAGELAAQLGPDRFKMALFEDIHEERRNLGWSETSSVPWVIGPPQNISEREDLYRSCLDADVMIFGACPHQVLEARTDAGKLTLIAAERMLKKPHHRLRLLNPRYALGIARYRRLVDHGHNHALAIGHYAPGDLWTIGAFEGRIWRWGYFADVSSALPEPGKNGSLKVLWVGRMLDWKRVDTLLRAIARIQNERYFDHCVIVGDGPDKERLQRLVRALKIDPCKVRMIPPVPFADVRRMMRESDVYVLPSNRHEGWGVVVNEAMSEGCVVVANGQAGASKELITDNDTGLLFRDGDAAHLAAQLERLGRDRDLRIRLRQQAWEQIQRLWHPRVAAERLIELSKGLLGISQVPDYREGPCAKVL